MAETIDEKKSFSFVVASGSVGYALDEARRNMRCRLGKRPEMHAFLNILVYASSSSTSSIST